MPWVPVGWRAVAFLALAASGCRSSGPGHDVMVVGTDYAFSAPDTVAAGPTSFHFRNDGTVSHELVLIRLRPGVTARQAFDAEQRGADVDSLYDEGDGLLYLDAGDRLDMTLEADLLPGRSYVLFCSLTGGPQGKPHVQLGMFKGLHVAARATGGSGR